MEYDTTEMSMCCLINVSDTLVILHVLFLILLCFKYVSQIVKQTQTKQIRLVLVVFPLQKLGTYLVWNVNLYTEDLSKCIYLYNVRNTLNLRF